MLCVQYKHRQAAVPALKEFLKKKKKRRMLKYLATWSQWHNKKKQSHWAINFREKKTLMEQKQL